MRVCRESFVRSPVKWKYGKVKHLKKTALELLSFSTGSMSFPNQRENDVAKQEILRRLFDGNTGTLHRCVCSGDKLE